MQGAKSWLLSVCMLVPITWLSRHAFEVATAFRREENSPPVEIPFGTKISTGLVIFLFLFFFQCELGDLGASCLQGKETWWCQIIKAAETTKQMPHKYNGLTSPNCREYCFILKSSMKTPPHKFHLAWEYVHPHKRVGNLLCTSPECMSMCVCVRVCACAYVRKHKGVHAYSHISPSAQQLSTPPRWLPESHHLHINLLQTSSPSPRVKTLKGTSKGCWDCEHRHWWSITPLSTTVFLVESQMQSYFKNPPAEGEVSEAFLFSTFF